MLTWVFYLSTVGCLISPFQFQFITDLKPVDFKEQERSIGNVETYRVPEKGIKVGAEHFVVRGLLPTNLPRMVFGIHQNHATYHHIVPYRNEPSIEAADMNVASGD